MTAEELRLFVSLQAAAALCIANAVDDFNRHDNTSFSDTVKVKDHRGDEHEYTVEVTRHVTRHVKEPE